MKKITLIFGITLFFSACSTNLGTFTIASTTSVPSNYQNNDYIKGESCVFSILSIPFGDFTNRMTIATMNALENANKKGIKANALKDLRVNHTAWTAILFGTACIEVEGKPVYIQDITTTK